MPDRSDTWREWETISVGGCTIRFRSRPHRVENWSETEVFQITDGSRISTGSAYFGLDDACSYSVEHVTVVDSPHLALNGCEHAQSLEAFVAFVWPILTGHHEVPDQLGRIETQIPLDSDE